MGTESSEVQENMFLENDVNVQSTGDETCNRMEAFDVYDGKKRKRKKAKSEKLVDEKDSNRNMEAVNVEDGNKRKKQKVKSEKHVNVEDSNRNMEAVNVEDGNKRKKQKAKSEKHVNVEDCNRNTEAVHVEDSKKRKKSKSEKCDDVEDCNRNLEGVNIEDSKKRKKAKSKKHVIVEDCKEDKKKAKSGKGGLRTQKKVTAPNNSEKSTPKKASKRVSFADDVEVYSPCGGPSDENEDLIRGKRFSEEEDKIVKEAVLRYIEEHALGDDGLDIVLHCKSHPEVKNHPEIKNCWKAIGAALPWRPFKSVYYRAHILFERAVERTWTQEEYEEVRKFYKDHGADWRKLGDNLGKHRIHVKDAWRRIKLPNKKKGHWSQEEYETLFDLVNMDLRMKAFEEKKTKHGMLRDNIAGRQLVKSWALEPILFAARSGITN